MKVASNIPSSLPLWLLLLIPVRLSSLFPCSPNSLSRLQSQPSPSQALDTISFPCPRLGLALCSLLSRIRHKWLVLTFKALCGLSAHHWPSHVQYQKVSSCFQLVHEPRCLPLSAMLSNKPSHALSSVAPQTWGRNCLSVSAKPPRSAFLNPSSDLQIPQQEPGCLYARAMLTNTTGGFPRVLLCTSLVSVLYREMQFFFALFCSISLLWLITWSCGPCKDTENNEQEK